eukprot:4738273-Pleurochrysis_carterae.AAC.1
MEPMAAEVLRGLLGLLQLYFLTVFNVFWTGPPPGATDSGEMASGCPCQHLLLIRRTGRLLSLLAP